MYFGQCLESTQHEKCPGEGEWTEEEDTRCPILIRLRQPPEIGCRTCERRYSKEGYFEEETILADTERVGEMDVLRVSRTVLWLDSIERSGFGAQYPYQPTTADWIGLAALADARATFEAKLAKKDQPKSQAVAATPEEAKERERQRAHQQMLAARAQQRRN